MRYVKKNGKHHRQKKTPVPTIYLRSRFGVQCKKWWPHYWRVSKLCNPENKTKSKLKGNRNVKRTKRKPYRRVSYQKKVSNDDVYPKVSVEKTISEVIDMNRNDQLTQSANTIEYEVEKDTKENEEEQELALDSFKPSQFLGTIQADAGKYGEKILTPSSKPMVDNYFTPRRRSLHTVCVGQCNQPITK